MQLNVQRARRHLLIALFALTFLSHLAFTDLEQEEIGGDENWYSYSAVYGLGSIVRGCRAVFGDEATCGVQAKHPFLVEAFEHTWLDRYIAGEIDFDAFAARAQGLDVAKNSGYGVFSTLHVRTPADIFCSLANLNALLLTIGIWLGGGAFKVYLFAQLFTVALAPILVMEICFCFFARRDEFLGLLTGAAAGGVWMLYSWTQMRSRMVAQPIATTLVAAGFLALLYGLRRRRGLLLLLGCALGGSATFLDIGLRPFLVLPVPMLLTAWLLISPRWSTDDPDEQRRLRRLAIWPAAWLVGIVVFMTLLFPFRTRPVDTHTPITYRLHLSTMLLGSYPSTAQGKATLHRWDGWWLTAVVAPVEERTQILQRLKSPLQTIEPTSFYRIWTTPWRGYTIRGIPIPQMLHRTIVLFGLLGLIAALGCRDERGVVAWLLLAALGAFMLVHGLMVVEPRRALPWLPALWGMGASLLGAGLSAALKRPDRGLIVLAVLTPIALLEPPHLATILGFLPTTGVFALLLLLRLGVVLGGGWWLLRKVDPKPWTARLAAPAAFSFAILFLLGQSTGDWRVWSTPLTEGVIARQHVKMPDPLPFSPEEKIWLLLDVWPDDAFELRVNGQVLKEVDHRLRTWQRENIRYTRIWRAVPFPGHLIRPGAEATIELIAPKRKGEAVRLQGDFATGDSAVFLGPSIEWQGARRSIWRERWNAREEPRVREAFDLRGVEYRSEVEIGGKIREGDLSSDFGRQSGRFRIYVGGFPIDQTPAGSDGKEFGAPY